MSVQRLSLEKIIDLIRLNIGEDETDLSRVADADTASNYASIPTILNSYGNQISGRLANFMKGIGRIAPQAKAYPAFWKTTTNLSCTAGVQIVTLPSDYDQYISFYETAQERKIHVVTNTGRYYLDRVRKLKPGFPMAIEICGVDSANCWTAKLWPTPEPSYSPTIEMVYYRIPAAMPNATPSAEYPDAPANFHPLWVYGGTIELTRQDDPNHSRFMEREREMLFELSQCSVEV